MLNRQTWEKRNESGRRSRFTRRKNDVSGNKLARARGFDHIMVETNWHVSVQLLRNGCLSIHPYFSLVQDGCL